MHQKILQNPKGLAFTALDADLSLLYFLFLYCCEVSKWVLLGALGGLGCLFVRKWLAACFADACGYLT